MVFYLGSFQPGCRRCAAASAGEKVPAPAQNRMKHGIRGDLNGLERKNRRLFKGKQRSDI